MLEKIEAGYFFGCTYGDLREAYDAIHGACGYLAQYFASDDVIRMINDDAIDSDYIRCVEITLPSIGKNFIAGDMIKIDIGRIALFDDAYSVQVVEGMLDAGKGRDWHLSASDALIDKYHAQWEKIKVASRSLNPPLPGWMRGIKGDVRNEN